MADELVFTSWRQPAVVAAATGAVGGRRAGRLDLTLTDSTRTGPGEPATGGVGFTLRSGADVVGLAPSAIRHRAPAPGVTDAEDTKFPHVDLHAPDLPWRYSVLPTEQGQLRPWLALVVGTPEEIQVSGRSATLSASLLQDYPLVRSHLWAHVQVPDDEAKDRVTIGQRAPDRFSRVLSLRRLRAQTAYLAVLVPTIGPGGADRWDDDGVVVGGPVPVLDSWRFATGEAGDFESLCRALRLRDPEGIGQASLTARLPGDDPGGPATRVFLQVRGALSALSDATPSPDDEVRSVTAHLRSLHDLPVPPGTPDLLGLPEYGPPWVDLPEQMPPGWVRQLYEDPRHRIHAGTGVTVGVEAQDELMRAAVEQAGALHEATALIARAAAGLALSGDLWHRSLPADPVARLAVLAPQAARLRDGSGRVLAETVSGDGSPLVPEMFTGAAQRLLDRTEDPAALWRAAVTPAPAPAPRGGSEDEAVQAYLDPTRAWEMASGDPELADRATAFLTELLQEALRVGRDYRRGRGARPDDPWWLVESALSVAERARDLVDEVLPMIHERCGWGAVMRDAAVRADAHGPLGDELEQFVADRGQDPSAVRFFARGVAAGGEEELVFGVLQERLLECLVPESRVPLRLPVPDTRVRIDPVGLSGALQDALDPRRAGAPARVSLGERVTGLPLADLGPPRFPLGLDLPTWSLLRSHEPDWFLPGAQTLEPDTVLALRTNPAFISAFLVGLNTQFLAEARWRGLPVGRHGTPLRMFFAPVDAVSGERTPDVLPIQTWDAQADLGDRTHLFPPGLPVEPPAEQLVVLFRTSLFRRYPRTSVYLQAVFAEGRLADPPEFEAPDLDDDELLALWHADRAWIPPAFTGSLGPETVFFVFDVPPGELDDYLVVLDEPPSETRFGARPDDDPPVTLTTLLAQLSSAKVAAMAIDRHTRVAISGTYLRAQGGGTP
ncbi:hypothetical protein [uncultured Serinicoccus sp.]|uniref:hypothetical protein n=1 Tax=uncultured Serinicoccus sp. TaxID=735514 RepID=UPI002613831D|nr:hypothetical protein [uncultured Serinicoccus sp.]